MMLKMSCALVGIIAGLFLFLGGAVQHVGGAAVACSTACEDPREPVKALKDNDSNYNIGHLVNSPIVF